MEQQIAQVAIWHFDAILPTVPKRVSHTRRKIKRTDHDEAGVAAARRTFQRILEQADPAPKKEPPKKRSK